MSEGAPQPSSPELSREEIYVRIKKKGEWIIEKNKPDSQYTLERFYPDGRPFEEIDREKEENFDLFTIDQRNEEKLFTNNFWLKFLDPKKLDAILAKNYQDLLAVVQIKKPALFAQLQQLADEKMRVQKEIDWTNIEEIKEDPLRKINETLQPFLEQAYLILREAGIKPGDIRR